MSKTTLTLKQALEVNDGIGLLQKGLVGVKINLLTSIDIAMIAAAVKPIAEAYYKAKEVAAEQAKADAKKKGVKKNDAQVDVEAEEKELLKTYELDVPLIKPENINGDHDFMPIIAQQLMPIFDLKKEVKPTE